MKATELGGEGETPAAALEALAAHFDEHGLGMDVLKALPDQTMMIVLKPATIRRLGSEETYEGWSAAWTARKSSLR